MEFDFLKDRYDFELERKDKLTAALTLPVGVLTGLGSLLAVMARSFTFRDPVLNWTFVPLVIADVFSFFICLLYLVRAYHRQTYIHLPLLAQLQEAEEELQNYHRATGEDPALADEEFAANLRRRIIESADRNTENNDARSDLLYWTRVCGCS